MMNRLAQAEQQLKVTQTQLLEKVWHVGVSEHGYRDGALV